MVSEEFVRAVIAERSREAAELERQNQAFVGRRRRSVFQSLFAWAQRLEPRNERPPCPDKAAALAVEAGAEG